MPGAASMARDLCMSGGYWLILLVKRSATGTDLRLPGPVCNADTPGRALALAILKLKGHEYLNEQEYAVIEEFLSKYGL